MLILSHGTLSSDIPPGEMPTITYDYNSTLVGNQLIWYEIVGWPKPLVRFGHIDSRKGDGMALATKLREFRIKKGKSLQDLADQVGASKAHIWDLETGRAKNPTLELLAKLAGALDSSVAELIGETADDSDEAPEVLAMFRELKDLSDADRETIKIMMERLKRRD